MSSSSSSALSWMSTATRSPNISTRAQLLRRQPLEGLEPQPRSLGAQERVELLGRPGGRHGERALPDALVARVRPDERLGPEADRVLDGVVRSEVDGARDLGPVEEKLRRARERGEVSVRRVREGRVAQRYFSASIPPNRALEAAPGRIWPEPGADGVETCRRDGYVGGRVAARADLHGARESRRGHPARKSTRRQPAHRRRRGRRDGSAPSATPRAA